MALLALKYMAFTQSTNKHPMVLKTCYGIFSAYFNMYSLKVPGNVELL